MDSESPISEGFRRAFSEPTIVLAEIAWRWTFGLAALALVVGSFFVFLANLPVTRIELLALRSHVQWLVDDAIGHILQGSGPRLLRIVAIVLPSIFVLWIAAAALGRAATLKALLRRENPTALAPQFALNFLRAAVALASLIGYLGALILAGKAARGAGGSDVNPGAFVAIFFLLAAAITVMRSRVNWSLYLGAIFVARDGDDTFTAIAKAVGLFRRYPGTFVGVGAIFGTIHGVLFAFMGVLWLLALSLAGRLPPALTVLLLLSITLIYWALCDFLYIARLATYVALDEGDCTPPPVFQVHELAPETPTSDGGLPSPEGATS